MVQTIASQDLQGHTEMEVEVKGPKSANALYIITGAGTGACRRWRWSAD